MQKQNFDSRQHFSIRKLTIGAVSVLIGTSFYMAGGNIAHADTVKPDDTVQNAQVQNKQVDSNSDVNKIDNKDATVNVQNKSAENNKAGTDKSATTSEVSSLNEIKAQNTVSNETANLNKNNNMQNVPSGGVNVQKDDTNTARVSNKSDVETNTSSVNHGITGIPEDTKLLDKDLNGFKQSYNETYDIVYQGNIPDNLKPTDIHKVIHYTHEVDDKGNIGYRDNATGKVVLNNWTHDI